MNLTGQVVRGEQVGSKFGVATANLSFTKMPDLTEGVYLVQVRTPESPDLKGLLHFGERKTFGAEFSAEVHILEFEGDLYDQTLTIEVLDKLREVVTFPNADALFTQIETDILKAEKFFLRRQIKKIWKSVTETQRKDWAEKACHEVEKTSEFQSAKVIYAYAPDDQEIDFVQKLCKKYPEKQWCFPRVEKERMHFYQADYQDLKPGYLGILEPDPGIDPGIEKLDLILVPAVAAGTDKTRLGRGGGFYDRFLVGHQAFKITVLPAFAVPESVPCEKHDQKIDKFVKIN